MYKSIPNTGLHRLAKKGIAGDPVWAILTHPILSRLKPPASTTTEVVLRVTPSVTSTCGQSIFRGDKLPQEDRGCYFVVDPAIHVLRRANIVREQGKIMLEKAESGDDEFLLSSDINCRFVNNQGQGLGVSYHRG